MKTILVPTDFSDTAYNAATYALSLARNLGTTRIVLYHAYELIVPIPDIPTMIPMVNPDDLRAASIEGLEKMKKELDTLVPPGSTLVTRADNTLLAATIEEVCKNEAADLIVMGITGGSKLEEVLVGSNTIDVVKNTSYPVLIVPGGAKYKPIEKIVFAVDLRKIAETTPVEPLKKLLHIFNAELHVINIDHESRHFSTDTPFETMLLDTLLEDFNPVYHFIDNPDVVEGIVEFAEENKADIILAIPKKHGLFEGIFKRSRTSKLAYQTHLPLLTLHE
ncbi:nucleotide-binding universal stress UspA family protein [Chitinophaga polysaccharea]|uniref:Nucleotide-binding universal stress UspA family protein n=1 Tax=Chitinophaga polysaccharea TaxID=1293035 RepID=A0A561Q3M1_9BACT|nr:universal stress protein [Chitinophaga polysaccharea]TWF44958.1 nucleotide-binding universal stress UspA family protein [Chitinophaga polysaccharea]